MFRVALRVEKTDDDGLDLMFGQDSRGLSDFVLVQWSVDLALSSHPFRDLEPEVPGDQGLE